MIVLRGADAHQKDLEIAAGMLSSKTVQCPDTHTVQRHILLVKDGHGMPDSNPKWLDGMG